MIDYINALEQKIAAEFPGLSPYEVAVFAIGVYYDKVDDYE